MCTVYASLSSYWRINITQIQAMFARLYALFTHSEHGKVPARAMERSKMKYFVLRL